MESRLLENWIDGNDLLRCWERTAAHRSVETNGESSSTNFWMTQDGTGSSLQDLPAALLMRRSIVEGSMISN